MIKKVDIKDLNQRIKQNFPYVDKPEDSELCFHEKGTCWKCDDLREELAECNGQKLTGASIRDIHQEMSRLSAKGWRWMLPSLLRYSLTQESLQNQSEVEFLIYELGPAPEYIDETKQRLSCLNDNQIACLIEFLKWCRDSEGSPWAGYFNKNINRAIKFLVKI